MPRRILVVDDVKENRELLEGILAGLGHEAELAADGIEALAKLKLDIDLVLLDIQMPGMDGFEVARRIRQDPEVAHIPIIMVTALTSKEDRLRAVEAGANDFIAKPVDKIEVKVRTDSLLKMKEAQDAIRQHQADLEKKVEQRTVDLRQALQDTVDAQRNTQEAHLDTIRRLALVAEFRDQDTATHLHRIRQYCAMIGHELKLPAGDIEILSYGSLMHDVGKIGVPDAILLKPGSLTDPEREIMKQHAVFGGQILHQSSSDLMQAGREIAVSHHEKWDGSGYPEGLSGEDIPLFGRICAIADVFDALTSERPYKQPFSLTKSLEIMKTGRGEHFDPTILDLFLKNQKTVEDIQKQVSDEAPLMKDSDLEKWR